MGYDADHPRALGEVGSEGVSVSTLDDMERLFDDIPLDEVTTSMTINCTASVLLAMYLAIADKQGVPWDRLGGTMQNDMLKEFIAQKEWICPPEPAVRIVTRHDRVHVQARAALATRCRSPATTSARPARRRCRSWRSRWPTASATWRRRWPAASTSTASRRGCRSSSTSTTTSSRRSPSCARRGGMWARFMKRALRREEAGVDAAAHARADRGRVGHGAAAAQQRGARGAAGAGRGAGRHPVAAHQLARRDVGAAHRGGGDGGAAHAADHRRGDRRAADDRSAGRQLLSRDADRPDGGGRARVHRAHRRHGRHGAGDRGGLSAEGDRGRRLPLPAAWSTAARRSSSA